MSQMATRAHICMTARPILSAKLDSLYSTRERVVNGCEREGGSWDQGCRVTRRSCHMVPPSCTRKCVNYSTQHFAYPQGSITFIPKSPTNPSRKLRLDGAMIE